MSSVAELILIFMHVSIMHYDEVIEMTLDKPIRQKEYKKYISSVFSQLF